MTAHLTVGYDPPVDTVLRPPYVFADTKGQDLHFLAFCASNRLLHLQLYFVCHQTQKGGTSAKLMPPLLFQAFRLLPLAPESKPFGAIRLAKESRLPSIP